MLPSISPWVSSYSANNFKNYWQTIGGKVVHSLMLWIDTIEQIGFQKPIVVHKLVLRHRNQAPNNTEWLRFQSNSHVIVHVKCLGSICILYTHDNYAPLIKFNNFSLSTGPFNVIYLEVICVEGLKRKRFSFE